MYDLLPYSNDLRIEWDDFIRSSKNGTFLFIRDYMDYHADRYKDCSFLLRKKKKPIAVLPANIVDDVLYSHQGLTYGGLITSVHTTSTDVLMFFQLLGNSLNLMGITKVIYKPVPYIYHKLPSQEDIYFLFRMNARKTGCAISSAILQNNNPGFAESRKSGIRKAQKEDLTLCDSENYEQFIQLMNENLQKKYGTTAVHSSSEMKHLSSLFPDNIKLFVVEKSNEIIAGTILFIMSNIVHVQYMAASEHGKQTGALDFLFDELINRTYAHIPVIDFGHSTEHHGRYMNENLIFQKEGFGGRAIVYDTYEFNTIEINKSLT